MSADFSHFKKFDVEPTKTAIYTIYEIDQDPPIKLEVKPAVESNKGYMNQIIKETKKRASRTKNFSTKTLKEQRTKDRELFPLYIIKGWENVVDSNGEEVQFSAESCKSFVQALPDFIFDEIRVFCGDISNFLEDDEVGDEELGE